jgi:RNase P subunit RPR2
VGRRGIKEYRAPEALALISADRAHQPLVCPSCGTRTIQRSPRRRGLRGEDTVLLPAERVSLTCAACSRHAFYITRGMELPRDASMDPRSL